MDWETLIAVYNGTVATDKTKHLRYLLYGNPGSGKTTLAATFPKPFFIDTDRGMTSIRGQDIPYVQLEPTTPFKQVYDILTAAKQHSGPFAPGGRLADRETLVLDGISTLADDFLLPETMREANHSWTKDKASYDEYGKLKQRLIAISNLIKDVSQGYNVVVTALVDEEKNETTGELRGKPLMTGKYRDKIGGDFDEEYYLEFLPGKDQNRYVAHMTNYRWFEAKTRNMSIATLEAPTYTKLLGAMKA